MIIVKMILKNYIKKFLMNEKNQFKKLIIVVYAFYI